MAAGYREEAIRDLLALPEASPLPPVGHGLSLARLTLVPPTQLGLLTRLLLLGDTVSKDNEQLPGELVSILLDSQLVDLSPAGLRPLVRITPFQDLLLVGDLHNEDSTEVSADAVENPHRPTDVLARLIPREPVARSLDIGTGSGAHALQLAGHSDTVLGIDVSPRAVDFARFNARLNGINSVQFGLSDVVRVLEGEDPFDLIVSNPPYLISPETAVVYRDGAGSGHVGTRVLTEAPSLLAPDGLLVCLTSWGITDADDPAGPIQRIARRVQCHGLTMIYARRTALDNALRWNAHRTEAHDLYQVARTWLDFYRQHRINELAYGIVIFTPACGASPWFRTEHVTLSGQERDRGQIRHIMSAIDRSHRGDMPTRLRVHPDHTIVSISKIDSHKRTTSEQFLRSTRGIRFAAECGPRLLDMIAREGPPLESGAGVMATMMRRLYELGLVADNGDTNG
ncbi:methyltransferase domain-containing protein [Prauserella flavalba]|uniref:methyltransferase domain-containing protein n=1 Tax=Prauserella flavalba TaxID=1477506 RepID=UPI0036E4F9FB